MDNPRSCLEYNTKDAILRLLIFTHVKGLILDIRRWGRVLVFYR